MPGVTCNDTKRLLSVKWLHCGSNSLPEKAFPSAANMPELIIEIELFIFDDIFARSARRLSGKVRETVLLGGGGACFCSKKAGQKSICSDRTIFF